MKPIITIYHVPNHLDEHFISKMLRLQQIPFKDILLEPDSENPANPNCWRVHVALKSYKHFRFSLRILNQTEMEDQILKADKANEATQTKVLAWIEEKQSQLTQQLNQVKETKQSALLQDKTPVDNDLLLDIPQEEITQQSLEEEEPIVEKIAFADLGLSDVVLNNLNQMGIHTATPIQALAIPPALEGCDLIGKAQTGTGKTFAFAIPIIERLQIKPGKGMRALILAPTRELAVQINNVIESLTSNTGLSSLCLYGGENIADQIVRLKDNPDIIVATPGRLLDLQGRGRIRVDMAEIFVLDEADRMTDMGFMPDIKTIFKCFYEHPQTLLFSATMPKDLRSLTEISLKHAVYVDVGSPDLTPLDSVDQRVIYLTPGEKEKELIKIIQNESGPIIVFTRTKRSTEKLYQHLKLKGFTVGRVHGDIDQSARTKAMEAFRRGEHQLLIATDVASRGLDIENISHVINFDLPMTPEDHLHRIGRTARAGTSGRATTMITHKERKSAKSFRKVLGNK